MNIYFYIVIALLALFLLSKHIQEGFYLPSQHPHLLDATENSKFLAKRYDDEYFGKYYYHFQNRHPMQKVLPMIKPLIIYVRPRNKCYC